jgi:NAD(P)H dehydrogenase (quinone)
MEQGEGRAMTRILVLYYSSYGHIARMAEAVAAGAREAGADVVVKRVPELVPDEVARKSGYKLDQAAPIAQPRELADYDAIIIGTPSRFGNMASQMKNFLDQTGGLWAQDKLVGKVGSVFTSTGSQHGGQESTILVTQVVLLHLGMTIVGLPYTFKGQTRMDEIAGGSPYGVDARRRRGASARRERTGRCPLSGAPRCWDGAGTHLWSQWGNARDLADAQRHSALGNYGSHLPPVRQRLRHGESITTVSRYRAAGS